MNYSVSQAYIFQKITAVKTLILILLLLFSGFCSAKGIKITDDLNNEFVFEKIPGKVITLAPNLTEMIFKLGAGKNLAGNTLYCNYPDSAKSITKVGDLLSVNYEKILTINPDIIFITVEGNSRESYKKLKNLGFRVFVSNPRNFEGIKKSFRDMGKIFRKDSAVESIINDWNKRIKDITDRSSKEIEKNAMFLISLHPIILAGKSTFVNEFLKICRLKNITESSNVNYPVFSREGILLKNPDIIIYPEGLGSPDDVLSAYPEWKNLSAFKNRIVIPVEADLYFRPGPRFAEAVEHLFSELKRLNKDQ